MKKILFTSLTALALSGLTSSHAALLAYNGFDGNATGFSSLGISDDSGTSLGYTDGSGNVLDTVAGSSAGSSFAGSLVLSSGLNSGTIYASFIAAQRGAGEVFRFDFIDATTTGGSVQSQFAQAGGANVNLAYASNGTFFASGNGTIGGVNTMIGTPVGSNFYVMAFDLDAGTMSAWYNPDLAAPGGADATYSNIGLSTVTLDRLQLVFASAPNNFRFDEVRVGTSFAEVTPFTPIPEPTSAAMLLGGMGLLALRRRR